jgi:sugar lactone lactonase YvrE
MISSALSARRLLVLLLMAMVVALVPATAGAATFPDLIRLPDGWQPEGIAAGRGTSLYVGSIPTGAVWKADARTGEGEVLVEGQEGRSAIGIEVDRRNRLFVAGGATGRAFVYDAATGADLASYQLAPAGTAVTFVNDVVVTSKAAFFTDSRNQQLYVLPLGRHGALPDQDEVRVLPLTGELDYTDATTDVDLNGIVAARGGRVLLSVQSSTGKLFRINPHTGATREVDLGGAVLTNGDGLLLAGRVLFVVQNRLNQIAVVKLSGSLDRGRLVTTVRDDDFDVPTTIAFQAGRLYAVNARFGTTDPQPARYDIVRVG